MSIYDPKSMKAEEFAAPTEEISVSKIVPNIPCQSDGPAKAAHPVCFMRKKAQPRIWAVPFLLTYLLMSFYCPPCAAIT